VLFLNPVKLTKEDKFYADCNERGINLIDRINGKPIYVYHYSIDRPNANWKAPKKDKNDWDDDDYDDEDEDE
jgi:hypothetical protein